MAEAPTFADRREKHIRTLYAQVFVNPLPPGPLDFANVGSGLIQTAATLALGEMLEEVLRRLP